MAMKSSAPEIRGEGCRERLGVERIEERQAAEAAHLAHLGDRALGVGVLVADEGDAEHGDAAAVQRLERQQRMVDGAERRSRAQHDRHAPGREADR